MVTEDYVSFDTAKLLKEKGFNEKCLMCWDEVTKTIDIDDYCPTNSELLSTYISAPTLQMAMKWLRENHRIIIVVDYDYDCTKTCYCYKIYRLQEYDRPESVPIKGFYYKDGKQIEEVVGNSDHIRSKGEYAKYEESCDAAIKYCLENLI